MAAVELPISHEEHEGEPRSGHLPRRDPAAREQLIDAARRAAPVVDAHERLLAVPGELGELLPGGGLRRGSVTRVHGPAGGGATSVVLRLIAAATEGGEWAGAVDADGSLGGLAALESGVVPERFALIRGVRRDSWPTVVAALLDGLALVVAAIPVGLRHGDARRLVARARERGALLVALESTGRPECAGAWPAEAALSIEATGAAWSPFDARMGEPTIGVEVVGKGTAHQPRRSELARAV